ncbi:sensor histidine kinase [Thermus islandicus]|uniref:sensor histidine kinase n=1 Tax=Thermus islandicus TaxID=540988 RepID=UPI0003B7106F|nr:HAMP domain-containing sensor histidine kinase [Thermus islandicus]
MNLRTRFALSAALAVALGISLGSLALKEALKAHLIRQLQQELEALLQVATPRVVQDEEGLPRFSLDRDLLSPLLPGTLLLLVGPSGLLDAVGLLPPLPEVEALARGEEKGYLVREVPLETPGLRLLAARDLKEVAQVMALVDRLLPWAFLLGVGTALASAIVLAGRALTPLTKATQTAHLLAAERAWKRRLPHPASQDEVAQMVAAFNRVLDALDEALEVERRFAQEAAHALRTPLTSMLGHLERGHLEEARSQAERLRELVDRVLLLARAEADALERKGVELDTVAFTEAEILRPAFQKRGLTLELDLPEEPCRVLAHPAALQAIVVTLLENALQHTARGGKVTVRVHGNQLTVENAPSHPNPGTGLGLRLVQTLARAQGGSVHLEAGAGFRAKVCLPPYPGA